MKEKSTSILMLCMGAIFLLTGCGHTECGRGWHHTLDNSLEKLQAEQVERYQREGAECARVRIDAVAVELCEFASQEDRNNYLTAEKGANLVEPLSPLMSLVTTSYRARNNTLKALMPGQTACS